MSELRLSASASSATDKALAELIAEITDRLHAGECVDIAEYAARCPGREEEMRRLLAALEVLDGLKSSPAKDNADAAGEQTGPEELSGTLGDFRIAHELGRGGMGVVYEAEQISLGRRVALKVLPLAALLDPRHIQRFQNEARAAASLHHEHIVPVYAVGSERGVHYYAMQLVDGRTLAQFLEQRRQGGEAPRSDEPTTDYGPAVAAAPSADTAPRARATTVPAPGDAAYFRRVAEWGVVAAEALEHAHQLGIVHRDVKPGNLMLDAQGKLWVTDFGLARTGVDSSLTVSGDLLGTLRYMSPEQALAKRAVVDHRTDIYSLGVTLYEVLTLQPPFAGTDRQELLRQVVWDEPRAPRKIQPAIPVELETIVLKALEKNPADRYATAQALADDLRRYLMHEPIRARRSSLVQRARKVARRHPGVTVTAAVAVVIGVLLAMAGLAVNNRMVRQEQLQTQVALHRAEQEKAIAQKEKAIAQAVRDFLQNKLLAQASSRTQADALRRGGGNLAAVKPNPTVRELLDRAAAVLTPDKIESQFPGQPLVQAAILRTIGEAYSAIGDFGPAISHLERARDLHVRELALHHPDTLATMESLAKAYLDDRKLPDATTLFERVLDLRTKTLGPNDPQTLASMNNLMRAYFARGQHKEVLKLREDIVRLQKARLGPGHPDTLQSMNNLANSYAAMKRFADARKLHAETLARRKAVLGADDPDTLASMNNLANCHNALGDHAESLRLHQGALAGRRTRLGPHHPDTLKSMNNVAAAYAALGQHAEALKWYEETLTLRKAKLRPDHPDTLRSLNHVAWLLVNSPDPKLWDPNKALALAKEAVHLAPLNGDYRNTLGAAYYRGCDWKSAVAELTKSMKLRKGGDSADWFFLAMAYWRLGNKDQGRMRFDQAVQWMEKNQPHNEELRRIREEAAALVNGEPR